MKHILTLIFVFFALAIIKLQIKFYEVRIILKKTNPLENILQNMYRERIYNIVKSLYKNKFFFALNQQFSLKRYMQKIET